MQSTADLELSSSTFARERVKQAIRRAIALRTLLPGQQVPEVELAASLGVSRTPVREALRELEEQGLVVTYPHRGAFVRSFTSKDVENLVYLRAAVEGMAAFQAMEHASRAEVRRLERFIESMASSDPDGADSADGELPDTPRTPMIDLEFHETLVELSANDELIRVWRHVDPLIRMLQGHRLRPPEEDSAAYRRRLVARHRVVVDALLSGDADAAERAARGHVIDAGLRVTTDMRRLEAARARSAPPDPLTLRREQRGRRQIVPGAQSEARGAREKTNG
jgi:DNA-binding GntR family transcriptional regulator